MPATDSLTPVATRLHSPSVRLGRLVAGREWYFEGNFERKRFGNKQIPTIESSRSTDREENQRAAFDGGTQQETPLVRLVTTSVLHKYFNRRLFRVLPIPCDFR